MPDAAEGLARLADKGRLGRQLRGHRVFRKELVQGGEVLAENKVSLNHNFYVPWFKSMYILQV
jgi:hypothetical protein